MTWLAPTAAWFALLIPAVLILWFLKMKRRDHPVSSTLLWSKVLEDKRVNSPFQRFRRSLLLLLQLLVIALVTAALAQPERQGEHVEGRLHLLLVDVSASMGVEDGAGSRLDRARARARERVDNMAAKESAVVIRFDRGAQAITPVTKDRAVLRRALRGLTPGVASTRIGPAMELALSIAERQDDAVAVIYSDGNFEPWEGKQIPLPLEYEPFGESEENAGITALSARPELGAENALSIFVEVRNLGTEPAPGALTLSLGGGSPIRVVQQEGIEPGGRLSHTFGLPMDGGGGEILEVVWEPSGTDRLAADDRAWIVVEPPPTLTVWQVGPPNFALDDALEVLSHLEVERISVEVAKERFDGGTDPRPDLVIWDRTAPAELPAGPSHLFLGLLPPGVWDPAPEATENPPIISWDREHPVNRFVGYSALDGEIAEGWILPDIPYSRAIVDSRGGALIRTFRHGGAEGIVVAFDAMKTRWPLRPTFPFFLQAAITHLGRPGVENAEGVRPGDLISVEGGPLVASYRVSDPAGGSKTVAPSEEGWLRYAQTDQLGLYRVAWTDPTSVDETGEPIERERVIPVSLLSLEESQIGPQPTIEIAGGVLTEESANRTLVRKVYWPWLLAVGILFLLGEWFLYHRR